MRIKVIGLHGDGRAMTLVVDAPDLAGARRQAAALGVAALELIPQAVGARLPLRRLAAAPARARFDLDLFCQELLAFLDAGISIGEALETLAGKQADVGASAVIRALLERVQEGRPLSKAMCEQPAIFPVLLTQSMRAAELTSDYGPALGRFVRYRKASAAMRSKVVAAALYPMILLAVSALVLLFLIGYVVPRFAQVYEDMGDRLPWASRLLLELGRTIATHGTLTAIAAAAVVAGAVAAWRAGLARRAVVAVAARVPRLRSALLALDLARLYRALALLLHGGIAIVPALDLARGLLPVGLQTSLDRARTAIAEGHAFAASLAQAGLVTVVAQRFFSVGEQTGRLAEMVDRAAEFHEEELARAADWLGRVMGPLLMLGIGTVIGLVVVLMYMPIFQLSEAIR